MGEDGEKMRSKGGDEKVPIYKLFAFADRLDVVLMIVGTLGAIGNGLTQPIMTVIFGQLINSFGTSNDSEVVDEISEVCIKYVYLAIGAGIASLLQMSCWMVTGERQATRIRGLYLKTILRQDIAFFDTETTTGEVIGRMSGDTILIQDAMGEKVGKFIQLVSQFLGGFAIAFAKGWMLALVLCSCIPALVVAGGCMSILMSRMSGRGQVAYAEAGNVVEQTVGAIRTVASFTGEKQAINKYNSKLQIAYASTVKQGLASGVGLGTVLLVVFSTYGLAVWYGSKLIIDKGYNGGKVINVIMAIMTGGISLGQTSPCVNAFAAGQAAAYKMFETIKRTPKIDAYDTSGTHAELIKDPDGAYSQLVRMQQGKHQAEETRGLDAEKRDTTLEFEKNVERSSSQRLSMRRSRSRGGSSRKSFSASVNIPGLINYSEIEVGVESNIDDEADKEKGKKVSIGRLAYLNKPELPVLLLGSVAAGIHGVIFPIFGLLLSKAIKTFYEPPKELRDDSRFWAIMYVVLGVVTLLAVPFQNYFFGIAGGKLIQRIRSLSFQKVVHQEISWFDDPANSSGAIGARLSSDASTVRSLVGDALALIVQNVATVIAGLVIAFTANWILAFIILAVLPLVGLQGFFQMKFFSGFSADAKVMYEEASQVANDAVGSIRTVASFCAEEKVMDMYEKKCEAPMKQGVRLGLMSGAGLGFGSFALFCTNAFCFYIGSVLERHGKATFGEVFKVFFALTMSALGVSQTSAVAPDISKAKDAAASIFRILDRKPKIDSSSQEGSTLATVKGDIEFQHVSFRYSTRPDVQIFKDLCLSIPSGKNGVIAEKGRHNVLMNISDGVYASLVALHASSA
ncbi:hypothetical protein RJ639_030154 [Escallonia herrerae]|uniref:ABC transmembrane type-1 domain-containing protein n=1 Tax=Escallonia herrerae TaxID=1293975 RepID=A0AA88WZZ6_9ASTE|nr:hypothetical protein RJ639_030154 [Escallonia herrerae]